MGIIELIEEISRSEPSGTGVNLEDIDYAKVASVFEQPKPTANSNPAIWDLVIEDMRNRDKLGENRYGTRLQAFNGRDPLIDAYQEALDLAAYLRQAIFERDQKKEI